ncbi:homocysteine S-methyltransferase family protein [Sulfuriroseicoccus oceanibius]|uniref:Homocysteine S-methyltransferase family protein n=1 Tax=Sulfuriroseicoccus oceanibius TaxID=2707525 RepID=A0A6B3L6U8_9BACT|nr:homocysteine S-methyltransferase family protein [Sulfuriroseicoccus oceanibius]QQL45013.1 homocysteine S-methyltransferase family protein [Sulfuriroseicoccus oceanibius]
MRPFLNQSSVVLAEGAIAERLRNHHGITLHPSLFNTPLIYDEEKAELMASVYHEYTAVADAFDLPILLSAPTWRLDAQRVAAAGVPSSINRDAVHFIREVQQAAARPEMIRCGALLGPANDCYTPELALSADDAERFHTPQAEDLATALPDFLLAQTLPAVTEALGLGRAMKSTGIPFILSFCIGRDGRILDGTPLDAAIHHLDRALDSTPLGYMINCSYPTFLHAEELIPSAVERLIGCDANASSKDLSELESADHSEQDKLEHWADAMVRLNQQHGIKILGGCCGTTPAHLRAICDRL